MHKDFIYTQTRLQARHGMRPDERAWGLLESQKDLANYLQSARTSQLSRWTSGLQVTDHHHLIESALLTQYRKYIKEVADWVPTRWRISVDWINCLTYLPVIDHLLRANSGYNWMLDDAHIKLATATNQDQRIAYLLQSEFSPLLKHYHVDNSLLGAWIQHWQLLLPYKKGTSFQPFNYFIHMVKEHRDLFSQLSVDRAWRQRQRLEFKLTMMFRRQAFHPVNVFVHLLLVALDVERLRAGIIQRCLFPDYQEKTA